MHSEGSCVLTSVFCGLSSSLTTKDFESWQVWVTLVTILLTLSKPELEKPASADDDSRGWQGWEPNIHFPGWWRVNKCGSKTKWGRSETLSNLTWWCPSKARRCHGKCWVVTLPKGNLRRRKEKSSPLIKVGGGDMEKASTTETSLSLFTSMHWRRKWQPTPVFLPGESQGRGSLVGCRLWGCTESDMTEAT